MKTSVSNYKLILIALILVLVLFIGNDLAAQCPMCRIGAETNLARGGSEGKGLNRGILFLLGLPYLFVGTITYIWWKNRNKPEED